MTRPHPLAVARRTATVAAVDAATATVTLTWPDGVTQSAGVPVLASYVPAVGDVTMVDLVSGSPVAIGPAGYDPASRATYAEVTFPNTGDLTSASMTDIATFTAIPVPVWAQDGTAVTEIVLTLGARIITAAATFDLRVVAGATNGTVTTVQATAATTHCATQAGITYTIPAATTSLSYKLQAQRTAGTGALRVTTAGQVTATSIVCIHL